MKNAHILTICLILFVTTSAEATRVLKANRKGMVIQQARGIQWKEGDLACAVRNKRKLACGKVIKATSSRAVVAFTQVPRVAVQKGDRVSAAGAKARTEERRPAATQGRSFGSAQNSRIGREDKFNVSGGFNANFSLFYPLLSLQYHVSESIALGIRPHFFILSAGTTSLTSFGGHLTFNFYSKKNYKGLWLQAGAGVYSIAISGSTDESFLSLAGLATLGWRLRFKSGFNIGIAAGGMYITPQNSAIVLLDWADFQPMLSLDIGFTF